MQCKACGANYEGAECPYCGTPAEKMQPDGGQGEFGQRQDYGEEYRHQKQVNYGYSNQYYPPAEKWYQKTWVIILFLLFFCPVGIFLMWRYKKNWGKFTKIVVTVLSALFTIYSLSTNSGQTADKKIQTITQAEYTICDEGLMIQGQTWGYRNIGFAQNQTDIGI